MRKHNVLLLVALTLAWMPAVRAASDEAESAPEPTIDRFSTDDLKALMEATDRKAELVRVEGDEAFFRYASGKRNVALIASRPVKVTVKEGEKAPAKEYQSLTLATSLSEKSTLQKVNDWNRTTKWSKAWLGDGDVPFLQSDLDLEHGVTAGTLLSYFSLYDTSLILFEKMALPAKEAPKAEAAEGAASKG